MPALLIHPHGTHKSRKSNFSPEFQHQFPKVRSVPTILSSCTSFEKFQQFRERKKELRRVLVPPSFFFFFFFFFSGFFFFLV
jgi:hypothetical protein